MAQRTTEDTAMTEQELNQYPTIEPGQAGI
jgi:hypothetical protein